MIVSRLHEWIIGASGLKNQAFGMDNALSRLPEDLVEKEYGDFFRNSGTNIVGIALALSEQAGLTGLKREAERLLQHIERHISIRVLSASMTHLYERMVADTEGVHLLHINANSVELLEPQSAAVGSQAVREKLPRSADEMASAAACLAVELNTASVFHSMRAVELAVQAWAKRMKVLRMPGDTWYSLMVGVDKAIGRLPAKTAVQHQRRAFFASASAHLQIVRVAWRNEVMHPNQSYPATEARAIFAATQASLTSLAKVLPKSRNTNASRGSVT